MVELVGFHFLILMKRFLMIMISDISFILPKILWTIALIIVTFCVDDCRMIGWDSTTNSSLSLEDPV